VKETHCKVEKSLYDDDDDDDERMILYMSVTIVDSVKW
jgi:hypothetical protein